MRVAVELAEQSIPVLHGPVSQLLDEDLNLFPAGFSERLGAAEVNGIGLHEFGIEFVLANDLAETVADLRAAAITVSIAVHILWRDFLARIRNCSNLLDRADADAVGLTQSAIDGTRLGYAHLGAADQRGNVGWIGVAVADKTGGALRGIDRCFEDETIRRRITQRIDGFDMDTAAFLVTG